MFENFYFSCDMDEGDNFVLLRTKILKQKKYLFFIFSGDVDEGDGCAGRHVRRRSDQDDLRTPW